MFVLPSSPRPTFLNLILFYLLIHNYLFFCCCYLLRIFIICYNCYVNINVLRNLWKESGYKLCDFAGRCLRVYINLNSLKRDRRETQGRSSHPISGLWTNHHGHSCMLAQWSLISHSWDRPLHHLLIPRNGLQWLKPWLGCVPQTQDRPVEPALRRHWAYLNRTWT